MRLVGSVSWGRDHRYSLSAEMDTRPRVSWRFFPSRHHDKKRGWWCVQLVWGWFWTRLQVMP